MKKIMFNDKYGLTQAVLGRRKTQTRRIVSDSLNDDYDDWLDDAMCIAVPHGTTYEKREDFLIRRSKYVVGEVVAIAQSYCDIADYLEDCRNATCAAHYEKNVQKASEYISWMEHPGFNNKMFVAADMMIHQIRITDVRVERLQEISEDCCCKEGIQTFYYKDCKFPPDGYTFDGGKSHFNSPREAFARLINKVSRKDVWSENPYVFVYDFELVK